MQMYFGRYYSDYGVMMLKIIIDYDDNECHNDAKYNDDVDY